MGNKIVQRHGSQLIGRFRHRRSSFFLWGGGPDGVWIRSSGANRAVSWQDLKPITVQIDGDVALAYYAVTWTVVPMSGESRPNPSHRLTVFRRSNGKWLMAGGTIAAAN
jgi:hypothetical protein